METVQVELGELRIAAAAVANQVMGARFGAARTSESIGDADAGFVDDENEDRHGILSQNDEQQRHRSAGASSDGGLLVLREIERRLDAERLAACIEDRRDPGSTRAHAGRHRPLSAADDRGGLPRHQIYVVCPCIDRARSPCALPRRWSVYYFLF